MTIIETSNPVNQQTLPNYNLSDSDMSDLFVSQLTEIKDVCRDDMTNIIVLGSFSPLANYVRSVEAKELPTVPELMEPYELNSRFMIVTQDFDSGVTYDKPAHVFRANYNTENANVGGSIDTPTGLPTFDDALKTGLVSEQELIEYYDVDTIRQLGDLYINVESNVAIDGVARSIKKPYSALGYKALFEIGNTFGVRGIVAYQNEEAKNSLAHLGLRTTPLVGNPNISSDDLDKVALGKNVGKYYPLTIEGVPWSKLTDGTPEHNTRMFTDAEYAKSFSRIAGMLATKPINIVFIS